MLRSDAERIFRRAMEDTKAEFTEEQIQCIVQALLKISGRTVEDALASFRPGQGGRGGGFFAD